MGKKLDAVSIKILWRRLVGITDEASTTLVRTSFSSIVRDARDFCCVMFNAEGEMIATNTQGTPGLFGGLGKVIRQVRKEYARESIAPGDIFITNDPWLATGHLNDVTIGAPFFHRKKLIGFGLVSIHVMDIGGRLGTTGSRSIYEEGLQIPLCKLCNKGVVDETLFNIVRKNVRVSDMVIGDIRAMLAALNTMSTRISELLNEHNLKDLNTISKEIISRSEAEMRKNIEKIPDGVYTDEMYIENKKRTKEGTEEDSPIKIQVSVEIKGSDVVVDYGGTSPAVDKSINVVYNYAYSYTLFSLRCIASPTISNNDGSIKPVTVKVPEGCILNATYPMPVWARTAVGHFLPELIFRALSRAIPDLIIAGSGSAPVWVEIMLGDRKNGAKGQFVIYHMFQGGCGAGSYHDGQSCLSFPHNVSNDSMELLETEAPVIFNKKALYTDSAGAGKYRGGFGQEISFSVMPDAPVEEKGILFATRGGRFDYEIPGILGGLGAPKAHMQLDGKSIRTGSEMLLYPGNTVIAITQGGGGCGSPLERKPELVEADVRNGLVSVEAAQNLYGVIIDEKTGKVDFRATKEYRKKLEK